MSGCAKPSQHCGLCVTHYHRAHRRKAGVPERQPSPPCKVEGCTNLFSGKRGMCAKCYQNARNHGVFDEFPVCKQPGCTRRFVANGLCATHDKREKSRAAGTIARASTPSTVRARRPHRQGRSVNKGGYIIISAKGHPNARSDGTIQEHRLVVSEHLGRPLTEGENVHHRNGIRHDNRIENLELWSTKQPRGQRLEDKLAWCRAFLAEHGQAEFTAQAETFRAISAQENALHSADGRQERYFQ